MERTLGCMVSSVAPSKAISALVAGGSGFVTCNNYRYLELTFARTISIMASLRNRHDNRLSPV